MTTTFSAWRRNLGLSGGSLWLIIVSTAFAVWGLLAVGSSVARWLLVAMSVVAVALIVFGIWMVRKVFQLPHMADGQPSEGRRIRRQFAAIVAAEFAGFLVVNLICVMTRHWMFIAPLDLIVVGVHFLPLARLFKVPRYNVMGILFCAISILTMLFLPMSMHVGQALSWFVIPPVGCALVCLVTAWAGLNEVRRFVEARNLNSGGSPLLPMAVLMMIFASGHGIASEAFAASQTQTPASQGVATLLPMASDADPAFEVATIKPNTSGNPSLSVRINGRNFSTVNTSLETLIKFAYGVQTKQIVGGPDWLTRDKFDLVGVPDREGQPSSKQWKIMLQKILADRFQLSFHREKRELAVYLLTAGKNGPNLTKSESTGPMPSFPIRLASGGISLPVKNMSMAEFADAVLQGVVLDRPVLDETGIAGRFDFELTWMPDDSQFGGHMRMPPVPDNVSPAPSLFTAVQEQLGLKLDTAKASIDVLVIDRVVRPTAN